jgi:predicted Zn-dependent peptidase
MKTWKVALTTLLLWGCATAGSEGAGPKDLAAPLERGVVQTEVDGIQVLVKRVPHVKLVAAELFIRGGVRNWTADKAGVERLALETAVAGGTEQLPKADFSRHLAALGTQLGADSSDDFSVIEVKSLTERWRPSFDLLADAVLHPALPASEIEIQRQLQLSGLRQEQEDPDALSAKEAHELFYRGTPYANRAIGTLDGVAKLTRDDLVAQLTKLRETSRWLLVVVGDVDPADVTAWASTAFAAVPHGSYKEDPIARPSFQKPDLKIVEMPLPTTYMNASFPAPSWRDSEFAIAAVSINALREKLFEEVRTKRQLSYDPAASLSLEGPGEAFISVTAEDPNKTLQVVLDVVHEFQTGHIDAESLEGDKRTFLTHFLMRDESTDGQASLLGRAQILGGDWRIAGRLLDRVREVTADQVQAFLREYLKNLQTVVLGDPGKIDNKLFTST